MGVGHARRTRPARPDRLRVWTIAMAAGLVALGAVVISVPAGAIDCTAPPTGLIPINDLGSGSYLGNEGGLYPDGLNTPPQSHLDLALELAASIVPRDQSGSPDPRGVIGLISIGVSNTRLEFEAFTELVEGSEGTNPALALVNGAQFGRGLGQWASTRSDNTWEQLDEHLEQAAVTSQQVQAAWMMLPSRERGPGTLEQARRDIDAFVHVLQEAKGQYPNLQLVLVSSREYGGYIDEGDAEPNAYQHGFTVKWLIEGQITGLAGLNADPATGPMEVPWVGWGPYLWADGTQPRSDGLIWECLDFEEPGVHPSASGQAKVADLLFDHFASFPATIEWFLDGASLPATTTTAVDTTTNAPVSSPTTSPDRDRESRGDRTEQRRERPLAATTGAGDDWLDLLTGVGIGALVGGITLLARRRPS